jgi:hypothetical protein
MESDRKDPVAKGSIARDAQLRRIISCLWGRGASPPATAPQIGQELAIMVEVS